MAIETTTIPAHCALGIRKEVALNAVSDFIRPSYGVLEQVFDKAGAKIGACRSYTFSISPDEIDIAAAFVIADEELASILTALESAVSLEPAVFGDVEIFEFEEGTAAVSIHHGSYNKLGESWDSFGQELAMAGMKVREPTFEEYVEMGDGESTADAVTELYWYLA